MHKRPSLFTILLLAAVAALVLHPNPFGNQPNAIFDENLFITSALGALSKPTLPGWDFTAGGSYYGGPLAYVVTALVAAVAAVATLVFRSAHLAQTWLLLHTGDLMETIRLANALFLLGGACLLGGLAARLKRASPGAETALYLLAGLLFSNSMFATLAQTGKVWILQILFDLAAACAVYRFETLKRAGTPPDARRHAALLIWLTYLAFLQNIPGAATGLWILYALFLRHVGWKDLFAALKRAALPMLVVAVTQISFFARFLKTMFDGADLTHAAKAAFMRPDGSIDWALQASWPFAQLPNVLPLAVPILALAFAAAYLRFRQDRRLPERWLMVLIAHPLLTYLFYHVAVFRFGASGRYLLPFSVAVCVTAAFLPQPKRLRPALIAAAWILGMVVIGKTAWLYWHPASERRVVDFFSGERNRAETLIVVDGRRLILPLNTASLEAVRGTPADTRRFELLRERAEDVARLSNFKPLVLYGTPEDAVYAAASSRAAETWRVNVGCEARCTPEESAAGVCAGFNVSACEKGPTFVFEGENFHGVFAAEELGFTYFVRKLK